MLTQKKIYSGCAVFMAAGVIAGAIAPLITLAPASAQTTFNDVSANYWAAKFIQELSQKGIIAGFPDGRFRPEEAVTRAQFAAMVRKAFQKSPTRQAISFADVTGNYWASGAIQEAYATGFLAGYPGNIFRPNENIPRQQVLVALANGLEYTAGDNAENILQNYQDSTQIAGYARAPIAAATEKQIVVNYPNVSFLSPTRAATRADVAAFIYQALVSSNQVSAISSPYIVALGNTTPTPTPSQPLAVIIPEGTTIPVKYDQAKKILVTKDETAPLTLTVSQNVITDKGDVLIPVGSKVMGQLKPVKDKGGSQFVAEKLVLTTGQEYPISATSEVITNTETIRKGTSSSSVLKNAALGAGAAAAVSVVTGDRKIAAGEILGGAGIGAVVGLFFGKKKVDLIAIDPNTDLQMTIGQNLQISLR